MQSRSEVVMRSHQAKFGKRYLKQMRKALEEASVAVDATQATRAKMAEKILQKAAEGQPVSQQDLKDAAIDVGRKPAA
jgi:L-alanine-DL-glutamate epimerase-like enolase superfamily enzyme